ncbi:hypothetical protein XENOCAPTIV_024400, partial [Xenoophorus captivus]
TPTVPYLDVLEDVSNCCSPPQHILSFTQIMILFAVLLSRVDRLELNGPGQQSVCGARAARFLGCYGIIFVPPTRARSELDVSA